MTTTSTETVPTNPLVPSGREVAARAAASWQAQSRRHVTTGDVGRAVRTQWAADLAVLHELLWESGLSQVSDPAAQLATLVHVVQEAFTGARAASGEAVAVLSWARHTLAKAFGAPVDAMLAERFGSLDHFDATGPTVPVHVATAADSQRAARGTDALVRDLRTVAADCGAIARAMDAAGLPAEARDQRSRAQLAVFEAFLVVQALEAGDRDLMSVDLRWELAAARLSPLPWADLDAASVRDELLTIVPAMDRPSLRGQLEDVECRPF